MNVVNFSALLIGRLDHQETFGTHFSWRLSRPQSHNVAGRINSMKNLNDTHRVSNPLPPGL